MRLPKSKSPQSSPTYEKMLQDRIKQCQETAQRAQRAIETSKKVTEESRELVHSIKRHRKKAG